MNPRKLVPVFALELLLKGGFFVSGAILYLTDKPSFNNFTLLNSIFTLSYNVTALGLPFLYSRRLHRSPGSTIWDFRWLISISLSILILSCVLFPSNNLYIIAAFAMIIVDIIYSNFRILSDRTLFFVLCAAGVVIFSGNLVAGVTHSENWRYFAIVLAAVTAVLLAIRSKSLIFKRSGSALPDKRDIADGLSFGVTHGLFWIRNGLDKLILFPIISSGEYSKYALYFFVVSGIQTAWTSLIRIFQKHIFDALTNHYSKFVRVYILWNCVLALLAAAVIYSGIDYGYTIFIGAIIHFANQIFVNLVNYAYSAAYYTISNLFVAFIYVFSLYLMGVSVHLMAQMFTISNLILGGCYILLVVTKKPNVRIIESA